MIIPSKSHSDVIACACSNIFLHPVDWGLPPADGDSSPTDPTEITISGAHLLILLRVKEQIAGLKLPKECNEAKFALFQKGPLVLKYEVNEEKLQSIQSPTNKTVIQSYVTIQIRKG